MKVVIRAGGVGSRLWPKSRENQPKQFQPLMGKVSMLQQTWKRARRLAKPSDIFVTTNKKFGSIIRKQLPELKAANLILEPERRDSGPSIAVESLILSNIDPNEVVVGLPSDHHIGDEKEFTKLVKEGERVLHAHPDHVLCMGIRPTFPSTAFGYIRMGKQLKNGSKVRIFEVEAFKEKPDFTTAKKFYGDWHYLWNANYFMWKVSNVMELFKQHAPKVHSQLEVLRPHLGKKSFTKTLEKVYPKMEKMAVEYVIVEPNDKMLVLPADIEWNDIGDWSALGKVHDGKYEYEYIGHDNDNVVVQAPKGKLVATFGLKDIAVIDTGDALLVCPLNRAQEVKQIVEKLKENKKHHKFL